MKIGIDARLFGPRVGGGGLGRYVASLIEQLQLLDQENEYVLFLGKENFHECKIVNPRFYKHLVDVHWYTLKEQTVMRKEVALSGVDFMHYPHWNIPIFSSVPFIVTIHDLILLEDKHSARSSTKNALVHGFKYAAFRTVLESAIHRSGHILTVSEYSKQSILRHFGIQENKISVTPNGLLPPADHRSVSLTSLGVYDPYILYVGNAYPHKNLEMLVHAFARIQRKRPHAQLVIAGRRDIFSRRLEKEAAELQLAPGTIRFIDLPTDEEIAALYRDARLFVFPSRIEGFGIPPLEAMQHGTPVASSNATSLPEVLHDAALYFDPDDIETLVAHIERAIDTPETLQSLIERGRKHIRQYNWRETAKQTLNAYQRFPWK